MLSSISKQASDGIKDHLNNACISAERSRHAFFKSNEEFVTAMLLGKLETQNWHKSGGVKWRVQVHKTGNSGETAESKIGADGIIQIAIYDKGGRLLETKGLLFQAKKTNNKNRSELEKQIQDMKSVAGEKGCALFVYDEEEGFTGRGCENFDFNNLSESFNGKKLNQLIADDFLDCKVGVKGLRYSWRTKKLYLPKSDAVSMESKDIKNAATIYVKKTR